MVNVNNPFQGDYKKVLCICTIGMLRSPTCAFVLSNEPFNFNTRACGIDKGLALIPMTDVLLKWADEIVVMDSYQKLIIKKLTEKPIICLNIEDVFDYRDPALMEIIKIRYLEETKK